MNKKAPLQVSSFTGAPSSPPSPSMCFPSPKNEKRDNHPGLCGCQRAPKSHCISAVGVLVLVLAYTAMGSILFVTLEGETEDNSSAMETAVAASKPFPRTGLDNADIRSRTVDRLWSITEDLNILYKENWTRLAAQEVQHFQDTLLRAVQASKIRQPGAQPITKPHKWSYASAFLYSLTLITTIDNFPEYVIDRDRPFVRLSERVTINSVPLVIAMVGLPARGKTHVSKKLSRYLNWIGLQTRVFNLGHYRRRSTGSYTGHAFFKPNNVEGTEIRSKCIEEALDDACEWLKNDDGDVGIIDATNSTRNRRQLIYRTVVEKYSFQLFFIEIICEDAEIIGKNIIKVKIKSPDYVDMDEILAFKDFLLRIDHYKKQYEQLDEEFESHLSFIKMNNIGKIFIIYNNKGHLQSRIVYYLMNIKLFVPKTIYLTRHGECEDHLNGLINDAKLTEIGIRYSKALASYIKEENIENLKLWTSYSSRSIQTVEFVEVLQKRWKALNEIPAGMNKDMSYDQIVDFWLKLDAENQNRNDTFGNLIVRLEPLIIELEREGIVLIVSDQIVLSCLLEYYFDENEVASLEVPIHNVIKLTSDPYGWNVETFKISSSTADDFECEIELRNTMVRSDDQNRMI